MDIVGECRRSVLIRRLGWAGACAVLVLVLSFVAPPILRFALRSSGHQRNPIKHSPQGEENLTSLAMRGESKVGEPFFLFSRETYTLNKLQYLEDPYIKVKMNKNLIRYWGNEGVFDPSSSLLALRGHVRAFTESFLIIETEEATIDAKNRRAWGDVPLRGFYTRSTLRGTAFRYEGSEERLYISGPVYIVIY